MKYPEFLYGNYKSLMDLPKCYQEYFIRWYYFDHSDDAQIPDTIPVENIEDYIVEHLSGEHLWQAYGFAAARNVNEEKDNLVFKNDSEFLMVVHFFAKLWFKTAVESNWIKEDITEKEFEKECHIIHYGTGTHIPL